MDFPDTGIKVTLAAASGRVTGVTVTSGRLVQASSLFAGRPASEVLALLPTLFALCGTAQALTGLNAMEQAGFIRPSGATVTARRLLVLAETVAEHGLALARDWPMLGGENPDMESAKSFKKAMAALRVLLYPDGDWLAPGGGRLAPDRPQIAARIGEARAALTRSLGSAPDILLKDRHSMLAWLDNPTTAVARLLAKAAEPELAGFGAAAFHPMPEMGPEDIAARIDSDQDCAYLARPDYQGRVLETGGLARHHAHPLLAALLASHGAGLLTRLAARLIDIDQALREMESLVQDLTDQPASPANPTAGIGLAMTQAARGLLAHRVALAEGRVTLYRILAPTEWNFHPLGPLAQGLLGAAADENLPMRAGWLAAALDPCVTCQIQVEAA